MILQWLAEDFTDLFAAIASTAARRQTAVHSAADIEATLKAADEALKTG